MSPAIGGQRSNALVTVIESERSALAGMLPAFMRGEKAEARFFEVAMALRDNDKLASCRPETIRKALVAEFRADEYLLFRTTTRVEHWLAHEAHEEWAKERFA